MTERNGLRAGLLKARATLLPFASSASNLASADEWGEIVQLHHLRNPTCSLSNRYLIRSVDYAMYENDVNATIARLKPIAYSPSSEKLRSDRLLLAYPDLEPITRCSTSLKSW